MIISIFLYLISVALDTLTALLPYAQNLPKSIDQAFQTAGAAVGPFSSLIPFDTISTVLGLIISIQLAIFSFRALDWLLGKIRGSG